MVIHQYEDPGHSWFKVKRSELANHGLLSKISHYSYQRGDYVYLEEDCDVQLYLKTAHPTSNPRFVTHHTDKRSKIRSYASFGLRPGDLL